jgi:ubiquinol-cytochrome c reductase cytochrome c1 subunit
MSRLTRITLVVAALGLAAAPPVHAAETGWKLDRAEVDLTNKASLQAGARTFVNYCLGCHGASLMRYNALQAIGLTDDQIRDNLMFTAEKVGMPIATVMTAREGKDWFGVAPPDLSVIARARGADWLYTYLRTFYRDPSTATGWNNAVFPNVGMPHVLWTLQGQRVLKTEEVMKDGKPLSDGHGGTVKVSRLEQLTPGTMSALDYDRMTRDLVNFLVWVGEPHQLARKQLGVWVLFALTILVFMTYFLYKSYWKNVH